MRCRALCLLNDCFSANVLFILCKALYSAVDSGFITPTSEPHLARSKPWCTVVKNVVNTCIHRRPRKNTKNPKLLRLYLLGLQCSSVKGARKFLQNLYSSVRFRSPPPITTSTIEQLSAIMDHI